MCMYVHAYAREGGGVQVMHQDQPDFEYQGGSRPAEYPCGFQLQLDLMRCPPGCESVSSVSYWAARASEGVPPCM